MSGIRYRVALWPDGERLRLAACDAAVYSASLLAREAEIDRTLELLSRAERQRHETITNAVVARRYAVGRRVLREILGEELGVAPVDVPLGAGEHGKPQLARRDAIRTLWFSAAHCEDLFLVALSRTSEVGIDVERARSIEHWERVADRVLDRAERRQLQNAVEAGQDPGSAFLRHWCRVEAELKAIGCGINGLEAHRAGKRPLGLRLADLDDMSLPGAVAVTGARYQAALALCSPGLDTARQTSTAAIQDAMPTIKPASTSTP